MPRCIALSVEWGKAEQPELTGQPELPEGGGRGCRGGRDCRGNGERAAGGRRWRDRAITRGAVIRRGGFVRPRSGRTAESKRKTAGAPGAIWDSQLGNSAADL